MKNIIERLGGHGLGVEDVLGEAGRKGEKIHVGSTDMRSAYYSASDGLYKIDDVLGNAPFAGDKKLRAAFKKVMDEFNAFYKVLDKYAWD